MKNIHENRSREWNLIRFGIGATAMGGLYQAINAYGANASREENMSSIHDPDSKLKLREINSEIPIYMQRIAEREMCAEHDKALNDCAKAVKEEYGDNFNGSNKLFEYCGWARDNKHLCYKKAYCNSELFFRAKREYLEYRQIYEDTNVLGKQRDAIHKGVSEERPTTIEQFSDQYSRDYFFDTIVRFGKQEYYQRYSELRDGIKQAEERVRVRKATPIEELFPAEKFQPYFTGTKSSFALADKDYVRTVEEIKRRDNSDKASARDGAGDSKGAVAANS